jgi:hypothetical protein
LIQQRVQLALLLVVAVSLGPGTAVAEPIDVGILGCLVARSSFFETLEIDDLAHSTCPLLCGTRFEQDLCDNSTLSGTLCAPTASTRLSLPQILRRIHRASSPRIPRGGIAMMYHEVARTRQRAMYRSLEECGVHNIFS